ncbi:hypothetical protein FB566_1064 [Stackebrandtia endophytica]|uniref:Cytidine deaminase n=1 Tax=Stackebrandtia endophytica TaxID=1496996 RepID=A0A543ASK3_9ACTN|nr:cytidine deaminase [Stackebrandtia endophytica]TQL75557.1 hypothetical protein FB566_1064 [Stackebrandtia endophytica]
MNLDPEDDKLVTLARAAAGRIGAPRGAAVRDEDGRTYAAASIRLPHLRLSALQLAVAQAAAAGAETLEAAAVVALDGEVTDVVDADGLAAVRDLAKSAPVYSVTGDDISQVAG